MSAAPVAVVQAGSILFDMEATVANALLRRSFDGGKTWSAVQTVADIGGDTVGNPAPVSANRLSSCPLRA